MPKRKQTPSKFECPTEACKQIGKVCNSLSSFRYHITKHLIANETIDEEWLREKYDYKVCPKCKVHVMSIKSTSHKGCAGKKQADNTPVKETSSATVLTTGSPVAPTDADALPEIETIMRAHATTIPFIPKAVQMACSMTFSKIMRETVTSNTSQAWRVLLMFAKCVLWKPRRAGRRFNLAKCISLRLAKWENGEILSLWTDFLKNRSARNENHTPFNVFKRAEFLAGLGRYGDACRALMSDGLAPLNEETFTALEAIHPAPIQLPAEPEVFPEPSVVSEEVVKRQLRTFPQGSSPGFSGLRAQHLLCCIGARQDDAVLKALIDIVNLLLTGTVPSEVMRWFAGALLVALNKKKGGVRPIAIGETLRRLTSKCLCSVYQDEMCEKLLPHQIGVAVPGGAEALVHAFRMMYKEHAQDDDFVILKVDFRNAFNMIRRDVFLSLVLEHFPALYRWCWACCPRPKVIGVVTPGLHSCMKNLESVPHSLSAPLLPPPIRFEGSVVICPRTFIHLSVI
jgi:hypothetical protein